MVGVFGVSPQSFRQSTGETIAHRAVMSKNEQMILWLAEEMLLAAVKLRDRHGRRPAAIAAINWRREGVLLK